ncbi:3-(3-hydroxyphenyl)propionate hydroxylase [Acinetobacter sp. ANC 5054]|uniref:bifunctional 3-(3-hydroxy-phenyl)propionate/3-hydroxycinnamic acid hydroxylase MhpA n=1 Tax=Acinetobacter sp. ANC 5054 TaxID=1977877 RepID=UPI000A332BEF|nr:bifunctional 3-(3-hydroxy-phenyl)propionate/3-hydroxycinnamic acid hydroxylase [Acinetobacter sp. ANC 5054]OTG79676.1 3-(3-hydroxyphenyl)propionate hydroxylase [Acinetobacter sp. ANC 5054]
MKTTKNKTSNIVDIVIAGLGPTGLVLAHILGQRGHRVVILEREPVFYGNARAVYTDDECMRIFQSIGMAEALHKDMLIDTPVQLTRPDGTVIGQYKPLKRPNGWPVINFFYQPYLETTLTQGLAKYPNVDIRRGRELFDFSQNHELVNIQHQATQQFRFDDSSNIQTDADGNLDIQQIQARYLIGADGGRSTVRTILNIEMTGKNFPEPWLVVDLKQKDRSKGLRHLPYFNFVVDPNLPVVSCIQPDGFHRFEFMLKKGQTAEYMERPETVRELLSKYVNPDDFEVKRQLVYTFNALVANQWRDRRVILAGDAAHMTPQFMGQGASSGIRDAYNLGWKLSEVLYGRADDSLLESYESERRSHAKAMIDSSVFLKDIVSMTHPLGCMFRDSVLKTIQAVPLLRKWSDEGGFKPAPVYKKGQYLGLERRKRYSPEGTLAPQPVVRCFDGKRVRLDDVIGNHYAIIGIGQDPTQYLSQSSKAILENLEIQTIWVHAYAARPQGQIQRDLNPYLKEVEDIEQSLEKWRLKSVMHKEQVFLILRPDHFVFALVSEAELNQTILALNNALRSKLKVPQSTSLERMMN